MDIQEHNETMKHLIRIVKKMNELGWSKINIPETYDLVKTIIEDMIILGLVNQTGGRSIERELWKFVIIKNAKMWRSTEGSKVYHTNPDCSAGDNIKPENIDIVIPKGYEECEMCKG